MLEGIKEVVIDADCDQKYIVAEVIGGDNKKIVVRGDVWCKYHKDIFSLLKRELNGIAVGVVCLGGGRINMNSSNKVIRVYDLSGEYGVEPDREQTVRMIKLAFPDFEVSFSRW